MFWKRKKVKKVAIVPISIVFALMQESMDIDAPVMNLKISYHDKIYRIGIASDYDHRRGFFDTVFFVADDCKRPWEKGLCYDTLHQFQASGKLGEIPFTDIKDEITILEDEDVGCPSGITMLIPYIVEVTKK